MQHTLPVRMAPSSGDRLTLVTFILAAAAAVVLVLLSGCHAAPPGSGFVAGDAQKSREARLARPVESARPLQPFDEGFVAVPDDAR